MFYLNWFWNDLTWKDGTLGTFIIPFCVCTFTDANTLIPGESNLGNEILICECKAQRQRRLYENGDVVRNSKFCLNDESRKQIFVMCSLTKL